MGYTVKDACDAVEVSRSSYYRQSCGREGETGLELRDRDLLERIEEIKAEIILEEAKQRIGQWIGVDYNKLYVHSELGYLSPEEFEEEYKTQNSLKEAA